MSGKVFGGQQSSMFGKVCRELICQSDICVEN